MKKTKKHILKKACGGKGGLMEDTIKEIPGTVLRGLRKIKNLGVGALDSVLSKLEEGDKHNKERDDQFKTDNWGSPENYDKLEEQANRVKMAKNSAQKVYNK